MYMYIVGEVWVRVVTERAGISSALAPAGWPRQLAGASNDTRRRQHFPSVPPPYTHDIGLPRATVLLVPVVRCPTSTPSYKYIVTIYYLPLTHNIFLFLYLSYTQIHSPFLPFPFIFPISTIYTLYISLYALLQTAHTCIYIQTYYIVPSLRLINFPRCAGLSDDKTDNDNDKHVKRRGFYMLPQKPAAAQTLVLLFFIHLDFPH